MIFKRNIDDDLIVGRLGNKLFVIAALIGYARRHGQVFAIGDWKYRADFPRIPVLTAPIPETHHFTEIDAFTYQEILPVGDHEILSVDGYFQSWKYFERYEEDVRYFLTPSPSIQVKVQSIFTQYRRGATKICSLHVRRGDYLRENVRRVHGIRPMEYYRQAMALVKADRYLVFSDDIPWCKMAFGNDPNVIFSEGHSEVIDLFLMSLCDANIITNSSFSWMGAWLGGPDRTVIAPMCWMAERAVNLNDLLPSAWMRLNDPAPVTESVPLVSIVIPCYKQAHFLKDALDSALAQDYPNVEIIVVNDGSPDNTSEVVNHYIQEHSERSIRLIEKPNGGLSSARNAGVSSSHGEWILPLDSDDKLSPRAVSVYMEEVQKTGSDIVFCDRQDFGSSQQYVRPGLFDLQRLLVGNQLSYCSLYRKQVWVVVGGYDENMRSYEDWNFWIAAAKKGFHGSYVGQPLFLYRTSEQSMYTDAILHHDQIFCQIVLNHQELYPAELVEKAKKYIGIVGFYGAKSTSQGRSEN